MVLFCVFCIMICFNGFNEKFFFNKVINDLEMFDILLNEVICFVYNYFYICVVWNFFLLWVKN